MSAKRIICLVQEHEWEYWTATGEELSPWHLHWPTRQEMRTCKRCGDKEWHLKRDARYDMWLSEYEDMPSGIPCGYYAPTS